MQRRILLTGSNGLLGQKIIHILLDRANTSLLATSRGVNRHPVREGYDYKDADICKHDKVAAIFEAFKPTDVIHTAAVTQVDKCESEHEMCDAINVDAVANLAALCKQHDAHLVHISTDFVFDGSSGPYKEDDKPAPLSYYGGSKLRAEEAVITSGAKHAILRTQLLYGITPAMSRSNIVLWVKDSLEKGKNIKVVNDQVRCPTLVEDLAVASIAAAMKEAEGIYHISGAEMMPVLEIAQRVADFWKLDASLIGETDSPSLNQPAKRPPVTGFIITKAQLDLDYKPHSFAQGLAIVDRQMKEINGK